MAPAGDDIAGGLFAVARHCHAALQRSPYPMF
jgi:hypothetical protein